MLKRIQAAVGHCGRNNPADVMTAQYLLNCVPAVQGGPIRELVVDGISGPLTVAAIRKFQTAAFGRADGRIDPGGATITALLTFDPAPHQPVMQPGGVKMGVKWGASVKSPSDAGAYKTAGDAAIKGAIKGVQHKQPGAWVKQPSAGDAWVKQPGAPDAWVKQPGKIGVGGKFGA